MAALPHRIKFIGRVYPAGLKINISAPSVEFAEAYEAYTASFAVTVIDSAIETVCQFDKILSDHPYQLWAQAQEITQSMVNLLAFQLGAGSITVLDRWIDENGKSDAIALADPLLASLCTAFTHHTFNPAMQVVFAEPGLFMALNDLILANAMPRHVLINCGRSVEAIRHLISGPGADRTKAWTLMQETLRVDRAYLSMITDYSTGPRHGDQALVAANIIREVRARTWRIFDRFLHYRLGNNAPLLTSRFPVLTG